MEPQRPDAHDPEAGTYGVQWGTIGRGLVAFWVSVVLTYFVVADQHTGSDRIWTALESAALIFVGAMIGMRLLLPFVSRSRLASNTTFLVVWGAVFMLWYFVRTH